MPAPTTYLDSSTMADFDLRQTPSAKSCATVNAHLAKNSAVTDYCGDSRHGYHTKLAEGRCC